MHASNYNDISLSCNKEKKKQKSKLSHLPSKERKMSSGSLSIYPLKIGITQFRAKTLTSATISARIGDSGTKKDQQQQLNLSVLRFTLGIPGLDESYLPRWIGYGFGSLLLLNHFVGSNSATTPAQLRTEALGLSLAAFSIALPYFGKFLKGANPVGQASIPQDAEQVFVMSQNISDSQKEDLAWASYILLRNTSTIAVLISIQDELCVRGYWNAPDNLSKAQVLDWLERQIENVGLSDLKDTLYFPQTSESGVWEMLPKGTCSLLVEPVLQATVQDTNKLNKSEGFILLASSMSYAYSDKDRAWIRAIANKFKGKSTRSELPTKFLT